VFHGLRGVIPALSHRDPAAQEQPTAYLQDRRQPFDAAPALFVGEDVESVHASHQVPRKEHAAVGRSVAAPKGGQQGPQPLSEIRGDSNSSPGGRRVTIEVREDRLAWPDVAPMAQNASQVGRAMDTGVAHVPVTAVSGSRLKLQEQPR
jgi:hypothetical protein